MYNVNTVQHCNVLPYELHYKVSKQDSNIKNNKKVVFAMNYWRN